MKRIYFFFSFLLLFGQIKAQVKINEIMASNASVIADNTGDYADWIELYNPSASPIDLASYYITDDLTNLTKFRFTTTAGQVVVPASGYLLIWASGITTRGALHTSFSLSASGEDIALVSPDGLTIIDSFSFTKQRADVSYGRLPNGGSTFKFFAQPTPNSQNLSIEVYEGILDPPSFSQLGGFYTNPISLSISSNDPQATIYYSNDGSEPDANNTSGTNYNYKNQYAQLASQPTGPLLVDSYRTYLYSSPLSITDFSSQPNRLAKHSSDYSFSPTHVPLQPIFKGNIIRAKAVRANYLPSETQSQTYIVTPLASARFTLPVISLAIPPQKMYDYTNGIYNAGVTFDDWRSQDPVTPAWGVGFPGNFTRSGSEWEVKGNIEFFNTNNQSVVLNQSIGVRIHGGATTALAQKSLRIYSDSYFNWPFFPYQPNNNHKRLILRNSGNDWHGTMFKDAMYQMAVRHLNIETQAHRASIVLLNGEYWGIHNLRERYDKYYFSNKYSVHPDSIDLIENNSTVQEGDYNHYDQTMDLLQLGVQGSYYDQIKTRIDIENFIDYQIAEIYISNTDWIENNIRCWRKRVNYSPNAPKGHDGRWRWVLFDTDWGFNLSHNGLAFATNSDANQYPNPAFTYPLRRLLENSIFKYQFINRYADLLNTTFLSNNLVSHINTNATTIQGEIAEHRNRWTNSSSLTDWENSVQNLIDFANNRPPIARQHIRNQFGISGEYNLTVNVSDTSAGYVRVNTIDIRPSTPGVGSSPYPWTGSYFKNITIKIHARPKPGYKFKHWLFNSTTLTDSVLTLTPSSAIAYTAVFESALFSSNPIPGPYVFNACKYQLLAWNDIAPAASYPDSMRFVYMASTDPLIDASIAGFTTGPYNYTSRTRINGLGNLGFSFINTGSANTGYPAQQLGGALLTISTANIPKIKVSWKGRTIVPNSKEYAIRLQARVGDLIAFTDVLDDNGNPIEYQRSTTAGDSLSFTAELPAELLNQPFIQLLWRYYYTGIQNNLASGARDQLAVDDIMIETEKELTGSSLTGTTYYKADKIISTVNVLSTSVLDYTAGQSVTLSPGFCTNNGTVFVAKIGCN